MIRAAATTPAPRDAAAERARAAIAAVFLLHGVVVGGWAPHVPLAKAALGVGPAAFGWLLLAMAAGGVVAMPVAGALVDRVGSAAVVRATGVVFALSFAGPALAATPLGLAVALGLFGAALGALDVAMNAHGLAIEGRLRRPVMSGLHGWYSLGAAAGAAAGGAAVAAAGRTGHAALTVAVALAGLVLSGRALLPGAADRGAGGPAFVAPTRATLALGALGFLALMVEGAMLDWIALHLREAHGAAVGTSGLGFAAFSTGMAAARFLGDRLRARIGSVALVRGSAAALALALAIGLAAGSAAAAIAALGLAGVGVGNIAPVLFAGGGRAEPDAPGRGVAAVTTLAYAGFLVGPPLVGAAAQVAGLGAALWLTVAAAAVVAAGAGAARAADG